MKQKRKQLPEKQQSADGKLFLKLSELNRTDEILKAAADRDYQQKVLKEFGL